MMMIRTDYTKNFAIPLFIIIFLNIFYTTDVAKSENTKHEDGFYSYVLKKGINITRVSKAVYRIRHNEWHCDINTTIAKTFKKENYSWTYIFETRVDYLSSKTLFSSEQLRKRMGVLPKDGTPITIVARKTNVIIPEENVIIRLNNHGPLNARTTMVMTWPYSVERLLMSSRNYPNDEIIIWALWQKRLGTTNGLWNTSQPLVVPEAHWKNENLTYYRGQLFFMKGHYNIGHFACYFHDSIGMAALYKVFPLNGTVTTVGFSTDPDEYNTAHKLRLFNFAHKLAWAYYHVKELSDTSANLFHHDMTDSYRAEKSVTPKFLLEYVCIYSAMIVVISILIFRLKWRAIK